MTTRTTNDPDETIPFGPVLLGQTEKTLQALLQRALVGTGLEESHWVALRLAAMLDGRVDHAGLVAEVADRTKLLDSTQAVAVLTDRGLVADGRPTDAGRLLLTDVLAANDRANGSLWRDLPADDVEAAERVLNEVLRRARQLAA